MCFDFFSNFIIRRDFLSIDRELSFGVIVIFVNKFKFSVNIPNPQFNLNNAT